MWFLVLTILQSTAIFVVLKLFKNFRIDNWQALTVIELLITDEAYRQQWPALIAAFQESGSTDIGPHLGPVLKTNWKEFEERWENHCRRVYGRKS